MAEGGGEAELFRTARIGVLWNMDLCPISPAFSDATEIAPQIKSSLLIMGYEGEVAIGAIGDTRKVSPNILRDMRATGIIVEHSDGDEHLNYKKATAHLYAWAMNNDAPANMVYISTDKESVEDLRILGKRGFNIIKAKPRRPGAIRNYLWNFSDIVVSQPFEENGLEVLHANGRVVVVPYPHCLFGFEMFYKVEQGGGMVDQTRYGTGEFGDYKDQQSSGMAAKNRDETGKFGDYKGQQSSGMAAKNRDVTAKNRDGTGKFGYDKGQQSSVMAAKNRDRTGKFGDYKGQQSSGMAAKNRDGMVEFGE